MSKKQLEEGERVGLSTTDFSEGLREGHCCLKVSAENRKEDLEKRKARWNNRGGRRKVLEQQTRKP